MVVSLIMFKDNGERKEFTVDQGKTIFGRKEDCDLRIPLAEISRKHAMMIVEKNTVTIRDMGSANGTYVNNKRISEQELSPGDHIVIGPVVFTIQIDGQPADIHPVHTRLEARTPTGGGMPGPVKKLSKPEGVDATDIIFEEEEDPISALEALTSTDDTAAMDIDDSFSSPDDSQA